MAPWAAAIGFGIICLACGAGGKNAAPQATQNLVPSLTSAPQFRQYLCGRPAPPVSGTPCPSPNVPKNYSSFQMAPSSITLRRMRLHTTYEHSQGQGCGLSGWYEHRVNSSGRAGVSSRSDQGVRETQPAVAVDRLRQLPRVVGVPAGLALCVFACLFGGDLSHFHQTEAADCRLFPFHSVDFRHPDPCGRSVTYSAPSLLHIKAACLQRCSLPLRPYGLIVTGRVLALKVIPRNGVGSSP